MEILEINSFWSSFDPRWTGGRAAGRPGRVTETFAKQHIFRISIQKNLNIVYIIESWLFDIFSKKTRAEISWNLARFSRRDLSYETNSGPKTKTVEIWDLAYYLFIVIFYYSSASAIFSLWYFINSVHPVSPSSTVSLHLPWSKESHYRQARRLVSHRKK